jgi:hypothetical protein
MSTEGPGAGTIAMRGLVRVGTFVGVAAHALLLFGGCLIPFTAGVSVVIMIPSLVGWPIAALIGWRGVRTLAKDDPARGWAQAALAVGGTGLALVCATLGLLSLSILTGVAIAELFPGLIGGPHHHPH